MALTVAHLTTGSSTTDGTSFATASVTPTAGALVLVAVTLVVTTAPIAPLISVVGNGIVYQVVAPVLAIANPAARAMAVYVGRSGAPSAGTIVMTGSGTYTAAAWSVVEVTGDLARVRQVASTVNTVNATAYSTTIPGTLLAGSVLLGILAGPEVAVPSMFPGTDYVQLGHAQAFTPSTAILTEWWSAPSDGIVDATATSSNVKGIMGIEVAIGGSGAGRLYPLVGVGG